MLQSKKHFFQYLVIRCAVTTLEMLPLLLRRTVARKILQFTANFLKRHRNIAHRNISLAYPESSEDQRTRLFVASFGAMGDLIIDLARFPSLTSEWAKNSIQSPGLSRLQQVKEQNSEKGVLLVSGHLGSFELSAFILPHLYRPISFLVRTFTNPYLDQWWKTLRESNGNKVVSREGGYREMVHLLRKGRDVGVLFDQNVTRNHAIFVEWFGRSAATTKALSLAALRTEAPLFVVALILNGTDDYLYECIECNCSDIYSNQTLSKKQKLVHITERLVREWEKLILKHPQSWFWIHRRWKTQPSDDAESFYLGC